MVKPAQRREVVAYLLDNHNLSERSSCELVGISRRVYRYRSIKDDSELIQTLTSLAERYPAYGFWKLYNKLRNQGCPWNHKRVYRVYCKLKLNIKRRVRKRLPARVKQPIEVPSAPDMGWSMDFMHDSLYDGRRFRLLNIVDDYNREMVFMEIGSSISGHRVVRVLDQLKEQGRMPKQIRVDNGPEFLSKVFQQWCNQNRVTINYIQPGKPTQNSLIERLNGSCRRELLNMYVFRSLEEVEQLAHEWQTEYNYYRPHDALKNKSPIEFKTEKLLH